MTYSLKLVGLCLAVGLLAGCGSADSAANEVAASSEQALLPGTWTTNSQGLVSNPNGNQVQYVCRIWGPANYNPFKVVGKLFKGQCIAQYGGHSGQSNVIKSSSYETLVGTNPPYQWVTWSQNAPSLAIQGGPVGENASQYTGICAALYDGGYHIGKYWNNNGTNLCSYEWGGGSHHDPATGGNVKILCSANGCGT